MYLVPVHILSAHKVACRSFVHATPVPCKPSGFMNHAVVTSDYLVCLSSPGDALCWLFSRASRRLVKQLIEKIQ